MWRKVILLSILASGFALKTVPRPENLETDVVNEEHHDIPPKIVNGEHQGKIPKIVKHQVGLKEQWGIVDVRPDAHMFYWLYYTTHEDGYRNRPVVMWLPGGPGGSATGGSNFGSLGPLDPSLNPRNTTWIQTASVLFIDTPVGAGFSWSDNDDAYNRNMADVTQDLSNLMRAFLMVNPLFRELDFYIFGMSYGGKLAPPVARRLYEDTQNGVLTMNIKGAGAGCPWINPLDYAFAYGEFLYYSSAVDENGRDLINATANTIVEPMLADDWVQAMRNWESTMYAVVGTTNLINFYHILTYFKPEDVPTPRNTDKDGLQFDSLLEPKEPRDFNDFMNGPVREKLKIIPDHVMYGSQSRTLYNHMRGDFMKPVYEDVDWLLKNTDIQVAAFLGQHDVIVNTKGALDWVQRLTWTGLPNFNSATRKAFVEPKDGQTDMYVKAYDRFKFYWMLRAGHGITSDMPETSLRMLNRILDDLDN